MVMINLGVQIIVNQTFPNLQAFLRCGQFS